MTTINKDSKARHPLAETAIENDEFDRMRNENLLRWPTGAEVDIDAAVARHESLPVHKRLAWVMRKAVEQGRCLIQPRGGVGTFELQRQLMITLESEGLVDIVPTTTDSYTRNEEFGQAEIGIRESERMGRSMLNGYPIVNYGVDRGWQLIDAIDKPAVLLTGTSMPRLTGEIGFASGFSGYLGSGIAYTTSYTKDTSIEMGIRNYQYLDRLTALYSSKGIELHRRQPGFLTGTNVPPSIAIAIAILDCLLAAAQGVRHYGIELGQCLNIIQDAASISACHELCQDYLSRAGYSDVFTPMTSLHWMGAWPNDEAQCMALVAYGGVVAAIAGAASVTTKSRHEPFGIPTAQANAEGARITRMAIQLCGNIRLWDIKDYEVEIDLVRKEVHAIVDKVLEMGDGDAAIGTVRAFEAGILDVPWSPNRQVKSKVLPARDVDGYIRIVDPGYIPYPKDVLVYHEQQLRRRCKRDDIKYGRDLAVQSVYDISEELNKQVWKH